jgi:hypothetical protein
LPAQSIILKKIKGIVMWFPKLFILVCIAGGGTWLSPQRSSAQGALPISNFLNLSADSTNSQADSSATESSKRPSGRDIASDLSDQPLYACACGCGIFEVGTSSMLPIGTGGTVYLEYDYQDQCINWNGHSRAPAADNPDKKIETSFYTPGIQYMFNRSWGIQAELPIDHRFFETTGGATGNEIVHSTWDTIGDLRIWGLYTGFFEDQSLGINFGLKFPTGDYTHNNAYGDVDRDSEIGTGSTDLLFGGFYRHLLIAQANLDWFSQLEFDIPFLFRSDTSGSYRPGAEVDGAIGAYYTALKIGNVGITPIAQVIASLRRQDSGSAAADPVASGYQRILLSPGVEFDFHPFMFYADVELPVYQNTNGDQLIGSFLVKGSISYRF